MPNLRFPVYATPIPIVMSKKRTATIRKLVRLCLSLSF
jgi:hypothetical protein